MRDDIVKMLMMIKQVPATYHSICKVVPVSAISERERKRNIMANTAKNPSTAVTNAENFRFFMTVNLEKYRRGIHYKNTYYLEIIFPELLQNEIIQQYYCCSFFASG
jgi:hypothetical protein